MKKGDFLWSAHRITEKQKAGKARNIKEKQLKTRAVRSQSSSSRSAVQQAIIDCSDYIKMVQTPRKIKVLRGFLIPKRADIV